MRALVNVVLSGLTTLLLVGCAGQTVQTTTEVIANNDPADSRLVLFQTQPEFIARNCSESLNNASTLNGFELFSGMINCYQVGKTLDAAFLLLIAQERSTADLSVFQASGSEAEMSAAELYAFIFYQAGGLGPKELYRDEELTKNLIERYRAWKPEISDEYNPGWRFIENPRIEIYQTLISEGREHRIAVIERHSTLMQNNQYFELSNKADEIRAKNTYLVAGSDDYALHAELQSEMRELSDRLVGPYPERRSSIQYEYRPDPNAPFLQLFMAGNGRATKTTETFTSREEAAQSWLSRALSTQELESVLNQIDFQDEVLVAYNLGEQGSSTGKIYITDLEIDSDMNVFGINVNVGVLESECDHPPATMFPFALASIERESASTMISSFSGRSNFGDGCGAYQSQLPTN
ncbi:MAG: hypothetical protein AAF446_00185 [Pseudomonadota bacterium]